MNFRDKAFMFLATGCFVGNIAFAPGTFGSLLGIPICLFLSRINLIYAIWGTVFFILFAIWIAQRAADLLKLKDPGCIVIDEIAGLAVTFLGIPFNIVSIATGFVLFRLFDIFKPFPIRYLERNISGGAGIVLDDVAAGIYGNIMLRIIFFMTDSS
jgi:phosphatidylglycerophosphatase A